MTDDTPQSVREHRAAAAEVGGLSAAVITVSDTRTLETDRGGSLLVDKIAEAGYSLVLRTIVPDDVEALAAALRRAVEVRADVACFTGGTGLSRRDHTLEALRPHFAREIPGFGELFRWLSFQEIGPAAMLSRAAAGVVGEMIVFLLPGSPAAVRLAWDKLIEPELRHLVREVRR
ncbi:MAG: molybdenum cofactor biosynthesis protein MoaB [Acidobacteriota bacterium]